MHIGMAGSAECCEEQYHQIQRQRGLETWGSGTHEHVRVDYLELWKGVWEAPEGTPSPLWLPQATGRAGGSRSGRAEPRAGLGFILSHVRSPVVRARTEVELSLWGRQVWPHMEARLKGTSLEGRGEAGRMASSREGWRPGSQGWRW